MMSDDPEGYHEHDGKAYCRPCYVELFAPYCRGCNKPIVDKICVTALNSKYHQDCFVCRVGALFNIEILIFSLNPNKYRHSLSLSFTVSLRVTFPISPLSLYLFYPPHSVGILNQIFHLNFIFSNTGLCLSTQKWKLFRIRRGAILWRTFPLQDVSRLCQIASRTKQILWLIEFSVKWTEEGDNQQ